MDIRMRRMDGVTATRTLTGDGSGPPVLVLTTFDDDDALWGALDAGAAGFVLKDASAENLIAAARAVAGGAAWLDPKVTPRVLTAFRNNVRPRLAEAARVDELTGREHDVLRLMARGATNGEIAAELFVSEATVKTPRRCHLHEARSARPRRRDHLRLRPRTRRPAALISRSGCCHLRPWSETSLGPSGDVLEQFVAHHRHMTINLVEVDRLGKRYGSAEVLRDVSFVVRRGELFGLLGTNGAGKTTTVEILQGLRRSERGSATVLGLDPATAGDRLRRRIGSQLQDAALPDRMRVGEALRLFSSLHASPRPLGELAEEWDLGRLWGRSFGALSGGERQRLFVALALVGRPQLVFLDELTQNLDPVGRRHTWDVIRRVRDGGTTVVLVTHDVEEAERLCDRIVVMDRGRVVADGTPAGIVDELGGAATVRFTDAEIDVRTLHTLPGVDRVQRHGPEVHVAGSGPVLAYVGAHLVDIGRPAIDLRVHRPSLEEQFVKLTQTRTEEAA